MRNKHILLVFLMIFAFASLLARCTGAQLSPADPEPTDQSGPPEPSATEEAPVLPDREPSDTPYIETPENESVVGEVPEKILGEIIADLAGVTVADRDAIKVVRAEAVVWNDGSLGCPKPGEFYIQILVNGYWVVLQVEGVEFDYRVNDSGYFTLCEE
jgi:hypothetical protein